MSRQNKVNPGMYTQRGRLTQDDAARELRRQRETSSPHLWQRQEKAPWEVSQPRDPVGDRPEPVEPVKPARKRAKAPSRKAKPIVKAKRRTAKTAGKRTTRPPAKRSAARPASKTGKKKAPARRSTTR